ncbi:protein C19orf12 homolog [Acropora millepora]|uniref:protein C19orf12 homolog n=1 Tax=Acropora millepora TaxID=45264 RepID=UPI001CF517A8|nr:protein C19orf12 homolog [Acropora millepora]
MPVSAAELQRVLAILADEDQLKVSVKGAGYGGVVAGVTTTIGGLIAGPAGLLVGGALGGVLAYANAEDFKPVSQVVKEMNAHERQLLYDATRDIVDNLAIDDYAALLAFLNGGSGVLIRQQLMDRMGAFLRDQMRLQMAA